MVSRRRTPLAIVAAVALVVLSLSACRGRPADRDVAASFNVEHVATESPSLAVEVTGVRGELHEGYMEWACLVRCKDPAGCSAQLRLTVHYVSAGNPERITFSGPMDVPLGARVRIGGVQRPPRPVDTVERVEIRVERTITPGEAVPTPEY